MHSVTPPLLEIDEFFEMSLDHLVVAGFDGYFKRLSRAWHTTFGWTQEEFLARQVIEFVHPDDREGVLSARSRLIDGVPLKKLVNRYQCKDGSYRWLEWKSNAYADRQLVFAVARDITEQKLAEEEKRRAQEQLMLSERMASIGRLAGGVAHEINNPLAFMMSNLRTAMEDLRAPEDPGSLPRAELAEMLTDSLRGAERVQLIVHGLQALSSGGSERRDVLSIRPVLELALALVASDLRRRRARIVADYRATPPVEADEARLGEVFINLLVNAGQAVEPDAVAVKEIAVATFTDDAGHAVIEVRDTGVGVPAAIRDRIFEPFFTTRPAGQGAGLGLSICHSVISGMGGEISVTSEEGQGTTIRVTLPAAAD